MTEKIKRDIFRFNSENPTAINLEHVTQIVIDGTRITFTFYTHAMYIDLPTPESALTVFDQILNVWSYNVVE